MLIEAIVITLAIRYFWEKGKREYAHTRDTHASELSRTHKDWSPRKIQRHARRRARGYWWDQIRRGFPDLKAAYEEDRLVAEAERSRAALAGEKRRKELRDQIREALEEHHRIKEEERLAEAARRAAPDAAPDTAGDTDPAVSAEPSAAPGEDPAPETAPADPDAHKPAAPDRTSPAPTPAEDTTVPASTGDGEPAGQAPADTTTIDPARTTRPHLRPVPNQPDDTAPSSEGNPMDNTGMGEALGYEQILAAYEADVERRTAEVERTQAHVAELEQADAAYENQMAMLRTANADDETIEQVAALREANEQQIATGREADTAAHDGLTRAVAARDDWVSRHGAVHDTKASTGARGDELLYT